MEPLWILSCIGVNCFVMITGYFICDKETIRWKGLIRTWIETIFYVLLIGIPSILLLPESIGIKDVINNLLLHAHGGYWFVTCYVGLLIVSPLLAIVINKLNKQNYQIVLLLLFILCFQYAYGRIFAGDHSLGWFIFLFMVAGYIHKFPLPNIWIRHKGVIVVTVWGVLFLLASAYNYLRWKLYGEDFRLISSANDGMMFFLSLSVFVYFLKTEMEGTFAHKLVKIAPYMFGVYLIHMNPFCFKQMWLAVIPKHYDVPILIHCLLSCLVIFCLCVFIDYLRNKLFKLLKVPQLEERLSEKIPNLKWQNSD